MRYIISPEKRAEVVSLYLAGDRPKNIAIALGLNDWNISVIMRRAGLSRNQVDAQQLILSRKEWIGNTQYTVNHEAFSAITPDSAYWAGFLMADGCIQNDGKNRIHIRLSIKDKEHLEKFRSFAGADSPPITVSPPRTTQGLIKGRAIRDNGSAFINIASAQMVNDLINFGVTPRKTFTACVRNIEMNRDFWRGAVDGDGSVIWSGRKPYLKLLGTEMLMTQFLAFCNSIVPSKTTVRPEGNIFKVYMSSGTAYAVIDALYRDASTVLDRKAEKARAILDRFRHYGQD